MKRMFLLFSHTLTDVQVEDARETLGVNKFIYLPDALQGLWSNVPPALEGLKEYLFPLSEYLSSEASKGDYVLIQGDFGGTCHMVRMTIEAGLIPIHSTTARDVAEKRVDGKVEKFSKFNHVIFKEYR